MKILIDLGRGIILDEHELLIGIIHSVTAKDTSILDWCIESIIDDRVYAEDTNIFQRLYSEEYSKLNNIVDRVLPMVEEALGPLVNRGVLTPDSTVDEVIPIGDDIVIVFELDQ